MIGVLGIWKLLESFLSAYFWMNFGVAVLMCKFEFEVWGEIPLRARIDVFLESHENGWKLELGSFGSHWINFLISYLKSDDPGSAWNLNQYRGLITDVHDDSREISNPSSLLPRKAVKIVPWGKNIGSVMWLVRILCITF